MKSAEQYPVSPIVVLIKIQILNYQHVLTLSEVNP